MNRLTPLLLALLLAGCTQALCSLDPPKGCPEPPDLGRNSEGRCYDKVTGRYPSPGGERCCECYLAPPVETDGSEPRASMPTPTMEPSA